MEDFIEMLEMVAQINDAVEAAFRDGYSAGRKAEAEVLADNADNAYDVGYSHGHAEGYDEGFYDGASDGYDDGYDDGFADGQVGSVADFDEQAFDEAFNEQPVIHSWPEGAVVYED